jgi:hypothetical protein
VARAFQFLSIKPVIAAFNVEETGIPSPPRGEIGERGELGEGSGGGTNPALLSLRSGSLPAGEGGDRGEAFFVCATLEAEIAQLDPADQPAFLAEMGLTEPASARMIRAIYDAMGLITFFTAGDNETKAWPLRRGSNALKAAATIHTDIARGFIRAEVTSYADWEACGSLDAAKDAGKMRLEGKEYVVQDGDVLMIRNKS